MTFDEILKWAPDNEDVFKELLRSIEKGSVIPFVGAGMSVPIYPLWGDVLIQLTEKLVSEENKKIITDILNAPSLPDSFTKAADNLIKMRSENNVIQDLLKIFNEEKIVDDDIRKMTVYLLPFLFHNKPAITTNYNRLLEHAYRIQGVEFDNVFNPDSDLAAMAEQQDLHCLFKIHGDVGKETLDGRRLIFSGKSISRAYMPGSELVRTLKTFYNGKMMLFLGSSLKNDITLEILRQMTETGKASHYAIIPCYKEILDDEICSLGDKGIRVIFYDPDHHEAVKTVLEELLSRADPNRFRLYKSLSGNERKSRKDGNPFVYNAGVIGFYGRTREMEDLQEFAKAEGDLFWWAVEGEAASGKTRLVYEFTKKMRDAGWYTEWIKREDVIESNNLNNRLILGRKNIVVADYGRSFARNLGKWMIGLANDIADNKNTSRNRILIIDRKRGNETDSLRLELMEEDYNSRLEDYIWKQEFICLKPLGDTSIKDILREVAQSEGKTLEDDTITDLFTTLEKVDPDHKRPLYAMFIAKGYCENEDPMIWDRKKALNWETNREKRIIERKIEECTGQGNTKQKEAIEGIRFISTINGDISIENIKLKYQERWEEYEREFEHTTTGCRLEECVEYAGLAEDGVIKAIRPDLIGEFFIVSLLEKHKDLFTLNGWTDNENLLQFLVSMTYDYRDQEEMLETVLEMISVAKPRREQAIARYAFLVMNITAFIRDINKRREAVNILAEIYNENSKFVFEYILGLYYLSLIQPLEEKKKGIQRIGELSSKHKNEGVILAYAMGLSDLIAELPANEAKEYIHILEELDRKINEIGETASIYDMYAQFIDLWIEKEINRNTSSDSNDVIHNTLYEAAKSIYYNDEYILNEVAERNTAVNRLLQMESRRRGGRRVARSFYHRSLAAFTIANRAYRAIYEDNIPLFIDASESSSRDEITNFLGDKFTRITSAEADTLRRNIIHIYNELSDKDGFVGAKQQLIYYITRLGIDVSDFIIGVIKENPRDLYIRLSLAYGCVLSDKSALKQDALAYARSIAADSNGDDAITNRGWTTVYFNDVDIDMLKIDVYNYRDTIKSSWKNARQARIKRFTKKNPRYKDLRFWIFDIPLFHSFLIDRGWDNISVDEYKILESLDFNKKEFDKEEIEFLTQEKAKLLAEYKSHLEQVAL